MQASFSFDRPLAIVGVGSIGSKVAWACARVGLRTRLYDIDPARAEMARREAVAIGSLAEQSVVAEHLSVAGTLEAAIEDAQLAFENIPERLDLKCRVHAQISALLDPEAYQGSNTSALLCSPLAVASGRPARFFNMNFSDPRESPLVELMGSDFTAPETIEFARAWAGAMGLVVLHVRREQMGYSFNRMWRVIKREVLRQIGAGVATAHDIDRGWMLSFGSDMGPCGMMDEVGLSTVLAIEEAYHAATAQSEDKPPAFLCKMVKEGALGVSSGCGFYNYPDPAFRHPDFLRASSAV